MGKKLENIDVNAALIDRKRREAEKDAFLLTSEEAEMLLQSLYAFETVSAKYIAQYSEDGVKAPEIQEKLKADVLEAYKERSLDTKLLVAVADKVLSTPYWSYELISIEIPSRIEDYYITAPEEKIGSIEASKRDAFKAANSIAEKAKIAGIPSSLPYVSGLEASEADIVRKFFTDQEVLVPFSKLTPTAKIKSSTIAIPISKAWNMQNIAAHEGKVGLELDVGSNASVICTITKDGKPTELTGVHRRLQNTIAQMFNEEAVGGHLITTSRKIYRALFGYDSNYDPSPEQLQQIEELMDHLSKVHVEIEFTQQIEKHKHMKHQPDYDYNQKIHHFQGQAIGAELAQVTDSRGIIEDTCYDIGYEPILNRYSRTVSQMIQAPKELVLIGAKQERPVKRKALPSSQSKATIDYQALREYLFTRIQRLEKEEANKSKNKNRSTIFISEIEADLYGVNEADSSTKLTDRKRRTLLKNVDAYLAELKENKAISNYTEVRGLRGKLEGYTIKCPDSK